jgi:hypothetical protein
LLGFKEKELIKSGCDRKSVIALSIHRIDHLRSSGISAAELLEPLDSGGLLPFSLESQQPLHCKHGLVALRNAGYSAAEILDCHVHNARDLMQAGYSAKDLCQAGVTEEDTRFHAGSLQSLCNYQYFPLSLQ